MVSINDPMKPPHVFRAKDGTLQIRGNEISEDEHRSLSFWSKFNTGKIKQVTRDSMIENIKTTIVREDLLTLFAPLRQNRAK